MMLTLVVVIMPTFGRGPIWDKYAEIIKPCQTLWWTNLVWINNFYPQKFDDKCLPWTWFVPCYIQMTIMIPIIFGFYSLINRRYKILKVIFWIICLFTSLIGSYIHAYISNLGGTIVGIPYINTKIDPVTLK